MIYAYVNPRTGRITRSSRAPDVVSYIEIDPTTPAAALVVSPAGDLVRLPDPPEAWSVWDWEAGAWVDGRDDAWRAAQDAAAWNALRVERDLRISAVQWRLQRWRDEVDRQVTTTDDGTALLAYVQALRDLPQTTADPTAPIWPEIP